MSEPITLTHDEKFRMLQQVSGEYLTDYLPDDWHDMTDDEQDEFLNEHCWEPLADHPASFVYGCISNAADCMERAALALIKSRRLVHPVELSPYE